MNFCVRKRGDNSHLIQKILLVMKLVMIMLTIAIVQVSAKGFAQKISLNEKNIPLEKVIDLIRAQSGYDFVYNDQDVKNTSLVTVHLNNVDLKKSLEICFKGRDLDFEIKEGTIVIKKKVKNIEDKLFNLFSAFASVKGTVIGPDGNPLPGVIIRNKDKVTLGSSNSNGEFSLDVPEGTVLSFSYIGFKTQEIVVGKTNKTLVISLEQDISKLDQVSVEGYRKGSRRNGTGNLSVITSEDLEKQPVQNPLQALEGRIPGMIVNQTSGVPGARLNVQVRGRSNFDKNLSSDQPLFILDGVPMAAGNEKVNLSAGPFGSALTDGLSAFSGINMADIESINVLKDADATAIYGSRGANGVILITTKKGAPGRMSITAGVYSGVNTVTKLTPMLNTEEYLTMRNEALANDKLTKTNGNAYDLLLYDQHRYTNFPELLLGEKASTTDAQLTVSGGSKYSQYRIGGGYHKEGTVWPGDKTSDRASLSFNMNSMSNNEKFTANLSGMYSVGNSNLTAVDLASAVILPPNYRLYDNNGNLSWNEGNFNDGRTNPLAQLNQLYVSQLSNLNGNLVLNYKIIKDLVLRSSMGYSATYNNDRRITPITAWNPLSTNTGTMTLGNNSFKNWIIEPQAEYTHNISKGKLNVLAGATYNKRKTNSEATSATGATSVDLAGSIKAYTTYTPTNTITQYNYQAFFGRINYNWEDKYIINFTGRRDGSSRFGPNYRFSNFGALGVAWVFTNEKALKSNTTLSYGKLRGSFGTTGNDQIGEYTYLDSWAGGSTYNDSTTLATTKLYNPDLHWERNNKMELALELGFFKDRILFSASAYRNLSSDPLVSYVLPRTTGFGSIVRNLDGVEVENKGLEITLSTQNMVKTNFRWSTDINLTIPKNKLKKYPNLANSSYANSYIVGESLNSIIVGQYLGVDPNTGLYTVKDVNGDGLVSSANDWALMGNTDPKYFGGVNNTFSYKGISLSFFLQFTKQLGRDWRNGAVLTPIGTANNVPTLALDRWQKVGDETNVQKFTTNTGSLTGTSGLYAGFFSNLYYVDASFLRLKNVYASYNVPIKLLNKAHISSLKVYVQAQNLFVITGYQGSDPETQNYTIMPPLRTVTAGLQLSL